MICETDHMNPKHIDNKIFLFQCLRGMVSYACNCLRCDNDSLSMADYGTFVVFFSP